MNNKIAFGIGGIVIGFIVAGVLNPTMRYGGMMFRENSDYASRGGMTNNIDQHFIEQMIPHHEGAIAMAQIALEKSKKPEILSLSKNIIEAQQREIDDMKKWYQDWFSAQVPITSQGIGMMGGGSLVHMGSMASGDLETLESAQDFDQEFIRQMIPHHEMAIMMARMLKSGTIRPEMLSLANNIIESQSEEITDMQSWYK